jgi:hypothetical protein
MNNTKCLKIGGAPYQAISSPIGSPKALQQAASIEDEERASLSPKEAEESPVSIRFEPVAPGAIPVVSLTLDLEALAITLVERKDSINQSSEKAFMAERLTFFSKQQPADYDSLGSGLSTNNHPNYPSFPEPSFLGNDSIETSALSMSSPKPESLRASPIISSLSQKQSSYIISPKTMAEIRETAILILENLARVSSQTSNLGAGGLSRNAWVFEDFDCESVGISPDTPTSATLWD